MKLILQVSLYIHTHIYAFTHIYIHITYTYTYKYMWFNQIFPIWVDNAPLQSHRLSNEITNSWHEKPSFELLARVFQETPKILQAIAIYLDCPPEIECKSLLLKTFWL